MSNAPLTISVILQLSSTAAKRWVFETNSCKIEIHVVYPAHTRYNENKAVNYVESVLQRR